MTVLVTGATGFIGGRLAERLLEAGEGVRLLVRRPDAAARLKAAGAELVEGSLENTASLAAAVEGVSVVYHCAGLATDWAPWTQFEQVNISGARSLAEAASRVKGLQRFVHLSTTDVYGYPLVPCAEDGEVRDVGLPYNRSKLRGEAAVLEVARTTGLRVTVVRPATVYGPRCKDWAVEMARLLAGKDMMHVAGGRTGAGLIYVDNLIDALFTAVKTEAAVGRTYNLRDAGTQSWRDYLDALADGLTLPRVGMSLPHWFAMGLGAASEGLWKLVGARSRPLITRHAVQVIGRDQNYRIERAVQELGFTSKVPFAEGLARTLAWIQSPEGQAAVKG